MKTTIPVEISLVEKLLLFSEQSPWQAAYRVVMGFLLLPLFFRWCGKDGSSGALALFFLGFLALLRLVPMLMRKLLPFSTEVQAVWFRRRMLSKQYDSFQWRKLFWIGLGMAVYTMLFSDFRSTNGVLAVGCLVGGAAGLYGWRRLAIDQ